MRGQVIGRWAIEGEIATGGFGSVFEARHLDDQREAAIKLLHPRYASSPEMRARFAREIEALRQVAHPNIVRLLDAGITAEGAPFLCMERLVGETLLARVERTGALPFDHVLAICQVVCDALATTHARGMVHRDINASNVFVCGESLDRVVLLDFGIAKRLDAAVLELTQSHETVGTPSWMSPEQIRGQRVDVRSDVYAVGALLFLILTGRPPFQDASPATVQYLHLHARRPYASELVAVSRRVDDVLRRAMAIDPRSRFADVLALRDAFHAAMRESGQQTPHTRDCVWLLLTVSRRAPSSLSPTLLNDLEAIMPAAERWLAERQFQVALDLGSTVIFMASATDATTPDALARALRSDLDLRTTHHDQVSIGIAVQRGIGVFVAVELRASPMISLDAWPVPPAFDGVYTVS